MNALRRTLFCLACCLAAFATARPVFVERIPNGEVNKCANCHLRPQGTGSRNAFGLDFDSQGEQWTTALSAVDSDGDGITNGQELQDPLGSWIEGQNNPGDPVQVSSPGRVSSLPGERLIQITEINFTIDEQYRVELTNLSNRTLPLAQKWLVYTTFVGTDSTGDRNIGQTRVTPFASSLKADERVVVTLNMNEVPAGEISPTRGFVGLAIFEDTSSFPVTGVDFFLDNAIGDYVEWGGTSGITMPYNPQAVDAPLKQWDYKYGAPVALVPGGSIEYTLAGDGIRSYYEAPVALTLDLARPTGSLTTSLGLTFPTGAVDLDALPFGFETINLSDGASINWPTVHGVVTKAPAFTGTVSGEKVWRVASFLNRRTPSSGDTLGESNFLAAGTGSSLTASVQWDQAYDSLPSGEQTKTIVEFSNTTNQPVASITVQSNQAGIVAVLSDTQGNSDSAVLWDSLDGPMTDTWFQFAWDINVLPATNQLTADVAIRSRDGSPLFSTTLDVNGINPTDVMFRSALMTVRQPPVANEGVQDTYFANVIFGEQVDPVAGFILR